MDATKLPKGQSKESNSDTRPLNASGIYRHRDTGAEYITAPGDEGIVQADALTSPVWKDAWEWVGEVPSRTELLKSRKDQETKDKKAEAAVKKAEEAELTAAAAGGETYDPEK